MPKYTKLALDNFAESIEGTKKKNKFKRCIREIQYVVFSDIQFCMTLQIKRVLKGVGLDEELQRLKDNLGDFLREEDYKEDFLRRLERIPEISE